MLAKLKCWLFGHRRMKRTGDVLACPRCGFQRAGKLRNIKFT